MEVESSGIFDAVKEIAQARARKLKVIRSLLENGDDGEALVRMRELVGLSRIGAHSINAEGN